MSRNPIVIPTTNRLFTPLGIIFATAFGSLVAGIATIWFNYRVLGYPGLANRTAAAGLVFYAMVLIASSMAPNTMAVALAVLACQCLVAGFAAQTLQGPAIEYHRRQGGNVFSLPFAALIGLLIGLLAVIVLLLLGKAFSLPIAMN